MCDICDKIDFLKDTLESLFDDEAMRKHAESIGISEIEEWMATAPEKDRHNALRFSLLILTAAELALKYGIGRPVFVAIIQTAITRAALRSFHLATQDAEGFHDKMRGLES